MDGIRIDRRRLLAVATAALAGMADWPVHAQARPEKNKLTVGLGAPASLGCLPLTIAERLGYFSAEGLEVDLHDFGGGLRSVQCHPGRPGRRRWPVLSSTPSSCRAGTSITGHFVQLGRAPQVALGVANRSLPAYRGVADLQGPPDRCGLLRGRCRPWWRHWSCCVVACWRRTCSSSNTPMRPRPCAGVRAGQVDAICHHEPVMSMLEHKSDVRIISDTRSLKGSQELFGGPVVGPCLVRRQTTCRKTPRRCRPWPTPWCTP
jgi:NitT/TauT family transport system substrate-binding protein